MPRPWNNDLKYEEKAEFEIQFLDPDTGETLVPRQETQTDGAGTGETRRV